MTTVGLMLQFQSHHKPPMQPGASRLDACSPGKGAPGRGRSLSPQHPQPLLPPHGPWRGARPLPLPGCTPGLVQRGGQVAPVRAKRLRLTCRDLSRGSCVSALSCLALICLGRREKKGAGKGKHSLGSCKSRQLKG